MLTPFYIIIEYLCIVAGSDSPEKFTVGQFCYVVKVVRK